MKINYEAKKIERKTKAFIGVSWSVCHSTEVY